MLITKSQKSAIWILSILFLPGVIIHELAHLFTAGILFVPTGEIEFLPQIREGSVKLGSVSIAKTDIIRRFLIGVAPIIVGLSLLLAVFIYFAPFALPFSWKTIVFLYVLFEIGNTMFSSKKDLEGALILVILLLLLIVLGLVLKVQIPQVVFAALLSPGVVNTFHNVDIFLGVVTAVDMAIVFVLSMIVNRQ